MTDSRRDLPSTASTESIVVLAGSSRILELLRLAELRSDRVTAVTPSADRATRRFVDTFAVELRERAPQLEDLEGAGAVLVALDDLAAENDFVRAARRRNLPIYVAGRLLVSDFTMLDLVEQRPLLSMAA